MSMSQALGLVILTYTEQQNLAKKLHLTYRAQDATVIFYMHTARSPENQAALPSCPWLPSISPSCWPTAEPFPVSPAHIFPG